MGGAMSAAEPPISDHGDAPTESDATPPDGLPSPDAPTSGAPGSGRTGPSRSTTITLVLGGLTVVSGLLLVGLPAWRTGVGARVTVALAVATIASGIVVLEIRRVRSRWAVAAVVVAGATGIVAAAAALPQQDLEAHVYGYADCPFMTGTPPDGVNPESYMNAFYAPGLVGVETSTADPLPFGSAVDVAATAAEGSDALARFTVDAAVDVTAATTSASAGPPANGVYLAVPVTIEAVDVGALSCMGWSAPPSFWVNVGGDAIPFTTVSIPGYPTVEDGGVDNGDGTYTYYDVFDIAAGEVNGSYELDLLEPDGTVQPVYWAEERR